MSKRLYLRFTSNIATADQIISAIMQWLQTLSWLHPSGESWASAIHFDPSSINLDFHTASILINDPLPPFITGIGRAKFEALLLARYGFFIAPSVIRAAKFDDGSVHLEALPEADGGSPQPLILTNVNAHLLKTQELCTGISLASFVKLDYVSENPHSAIIQYQNPGESVTGTHGFMVANSILAGPLMIDSVSEIRVAPFDF